MANFLSRSLNQMLINLGDPTEISGPPNPKKATYNKSVSWPLAKPLFMHEKPTFTDAIKSEQRNHRRSFIAPHGKAVAI